MECVCFPKIYEKYKDIIEGDGCIAVKGALSIRNGEKSILVDKIKKLE
jgi:DNA polymerase III alpha subunit